MSIKKMSRLAAVVAFLSPMVVQATTQISNGLNTIQDLKSDNQVILAFESMDVSDSSIVFDGTSKLTVTEGGKYQVSYSVNWGINSNRRRQIKTYLVKNGSLIVTNSTAYEYARNNNEAKFATNSHSIILELIAGDYLEVAAIGEKGDGTSLGNGTALTQAGESTFAITPLNSGAAVASGSLNWNDCESFNINPLGPSTWTSRSCSAGYALVAWSCQPSLDFGGNSTTTYIQYCELSDPNTLRIRNDSLNFNGAAMKCCAVNP